MPAAQHLSTGSGRSRAPRRRHADRAAALTAKVAASAGVSADLAGFSTLSEERLLEAQKSATALDAAGMGDLVAHGLALGPVIDGDLLPQSTRVSIAAGVGGQAARPRDDG
jgi:para-nitrobenzyl esterase